MHIIFAFDIFVFNIFITQIQFYTIPKNPQMCPAHRDLPTPPTLTLGSTFRIQYHHIPITASRLFHSQHPFRPFSSIGSAFRPHHRRIHITASRLFHSRHPFRPFSSIGSTFRSQHRRIQTQVNKTPTLHNQALLKKSPRGVQRGRGFAAPLRFTFSSKKNTVRHSPKKQTPHSILKKVFPTSCYFT